MADKQRRQKPRWRLLFYLGDHAVWMKDTRPDPMYYVTHDEDDPAKDAGGYFLLSDALRAHGL